MYRYLSGRLRQLGLSQGDLGSALGLSPASMSRRFNGSIPWSVDEVYKVLELCRASPEEFPIYFPQQKRGRGVA